VANPNKVITNVEVIYFTPKGEVAGPKFVMQPYTRVSINEADVVLGEWSVSLLVRGDQNLGVDRETLWNNRVGMASSTAVGYSPTSGFDEWCCAEGSTKGGMDTWIEIMNAYTKKAVVHIAYMTLGVIVSADSPGGGNQVLSSLLASVCAYAVQGIGVT